MNRPSIYTVHCKVKKHQNIVCLLQKTVGKKHGLKCHYSKNHINNHILIVSSTHGASAKHFLHWPRPYFTGIYLVLFVYL